jgi:pimeloyl-ACP methyl ester carboxylesterase
MNTCCEHCALQAVAITTVHGGNPTASEVIMNDKAGSRGLFGYVDVPEGQLHYRDEGSGSPIVLLHQTPRTLDEFAELQPLLARNHRVVAMDVVGFGSSPPAPRPHTIEAMASGAISLIEALGLHDVVVVGHHTGAAVAIEVGASRPDLVRALVLSSAPWTDAEFRLRHADGPGVDDAVPRPDGSHLVELWAKRAPFYPPNRHDLLDRFIRDALAPGVDPVEGHRACARYRMEERIGFVTAPVLMIGAAADPFAMPDLPRVREALTGSMEVETVVIEGGMIPLMETHADAVAAAIKAFIQDVAGAGQRAE